MPRKQKKYHYIYKTTNLINRKYYIGMHSTSNLKDGYIGSGKKLWYSIKKYGKENFKCEILEFLPDRSSLKERERELINEDLLKDVMCMNLQIGGGGGFSTKEHQIKAQTSGLKKMLNERKNIERSKWLRENDSEWAYNWKKSISDGLKGNKNWVGKKHKEGTKQKIGKSNSIKQKGENNSQFGTCWITNGSENKKIKKEISIPEGWVLGRTIKNNNIFL